MKSRQRYAPRRGFTGNQFVRLEPLGDQALLAYCDTEDDATRLAAHLRSDLPTWCVDVVQAYLSVAIYYDIATIDCVQVADWLAAHPLDQSSVVLHAGRLHIIPCCYEMGLDFERLENHLGMTRDAIITLHARGVYTVYAIGFCPGFPYLGYLPQELTGAPRLESPRLKVEAGSVGMTGRQTGIYTEVRPGGWNIVGRTPLNLVDIAAGYFPLRTGDRVQFRRIDERTYRELLGERL